MKTNSSELYIIFNIIICVKIIIRYDSEVYDTL